jgi:hypothetical protein
MCRCKHGVFMSRMFKHYIALKSFVSVHEAFGNVCPDKKVLYKMVVPNQWFVNPIFQGVDRKISAMAYFLCLDFDKVISNLVSFATAHFRKKILEFTVL